MLKALRQIYISGLLASSCLLTSTRADQLSRAPGPSALSPGPGGHPCSDGQWLCKDGLTCVAENNTCSGVPECPDGSDEAVSLCGCLAGEFECIDQCVPEMLRCDTSRHCKYGEDEEGCDTWHCLASHFKCHNGFCIPSESVCDFVNDCGDDSDEVHCDHRDCYFKEFRCDNGECVRPGFVCDGEKDCVDGSDEKQCSTYDFAFCGSGKRVHRFFWCDGWPDCEDNHADETKCGPCSEAEFRCSDNQCISLGNMCDAQCDCADCADENDCDRFYTVVSGVPQCRIGASAPCIVNPLDRGKDRCIAVPFICDGINHCHNGGQISDETGCDFCADSSQVNQTKFLRCRGDGRCLPREVKCDLKIDCLFGDDEENCGYRRCGANEWRCASGECVALESHCDVKFDCQDKSDEMHCEAKLCEPGKRRCSSGQCVDSEHFCDFYQDCPDKSDELSCGESTPCQEDEFACGDGGQCVPAESRCVLDQERSRKCADGTHLLACKTFNCPPGMFKCRSGPCLDSSKQCDGYIDCPDTWDDEDVCDFQCSFSAPECRCHHLEANCSSLQLVQLPDIEPQINRYLLANNNLSYSLKKGFFADRSNMVYLDLSSNGIRELPNGVFGALWRLRILVLRNNFISELTEGAFAHLHNLRTLDLEGNNLVSIGPMAFYGLSTLPTLDLSNQNLQFISPRAFVGLRNLTTLKISQNSLRELQDATFFGLSQLRQLNIKENPLDRVSANSFATMPKLQHLLTDERRWCCLAPKVAKCLPPADEFSSCEDLMSSGVLRVCIWVLGVIALLGNSFVIVWRCIYNSGNKLHSFLIVNLAFGDLMMGVYLLLIAGVDIYFRGVYAAAEQTWRRSFLCKTAGFFSTISSELSVFTLTVITVDRLIVIKFPFGTRRFDGTGTPLVMGVVWVLVILLAGLPLAPIDYFSNFYGRSGVCLALHITNEKPNGWEYAVFIFLVLNFISFAIIAISYILMYATAKSTQTAAQDSERDEPPSRSDSSASMAKRMTLIVVTDAACWLPIIILGIMSLVGIAIPPKVYAWVAVFILPLNAAVNPILYTLSTAPVRKRIRRLYYPLVLKDFRTQNRSAFGRSVSCGNWKSSMKTRLTFEEPEAQQVETRLIAAEPTVTMVISSSRNNHEENWHLNNHGRDLSFKDCSERHDPHVAGEHSDDPDVGLFISLQELSNSRSKLKTNGKRNSRKQAVDHRYD